MGSLGSYLKNAREARGLDLRDAAQQTRISIGYLKAIEEEDFSKLPGSVFVKGFLKNYAKYLQLPEDEVMQRFGEIGKPQTAAAPAGALPKDERQKRAAAAPIPETPTQPERPGRLGIEPFLWAGAIIIGLVTFVLVAMPGKEHRREQADSVVSTATATGHLQSAATTTAKPEKLYLEIIALEDVWVLVRTDASPQKKAALKKGETVTWSADERFLLSYAGIGSAKLVLNGKELVVNGPKNAVVRDLIVTATGIAFQKVEAEQPKVRKPKPVTQPTATGQPQPAPQTPQASAPAPAAPDQSPPSQVAPIMLPPRE